jgi:hypothetical protein
VFARVVLTVFLRNDAPDLRVITLDGSFSLCRMHRDKLIGVKSRKHLHETTAVKI